MDLPDVILERGHEPITFNGLKSNLEGNGYIEWHLYLHVECAIQLRKAWCIPDISLNLIKYTR